MPTPAAKQKSDLKYYLQFIELLWKDTPESSRLPAPDKRGSSWDEDRAGEYLADFRTELGASNNSVHTASLYDIEEIENMCVRDGYEINVINQQFSYDISAIVKAFRLDCKSKPGTKASYVTGRWTHAEIALLIEYYSPIDKSEAQQRLGRSPRAIDLKVKELGIVSFLNEIELPGLRSSFYTHRSMETLKSIRVFADQFTVQELTAHYRINDIETILPAIYHCETKYPLLGLMAEPSQEQIKAQENDIKQAVLECDLSIPDDIIACVLEVSLHTVIEIRNEIHHKYREVPITAKVDERLVQVGNWTIDYWAFSFLNSEKDLKFKNQILKANDIPVIDLDPTFDKGILAQRQYYARYLGNKFNRRLRGAAYRVFIKPVETELNSYCSAFKSVGRGRVEKYYPDELIEPCFKASQQGMIKEIEDDGIEHIGPWVIYLGKRPSELKLALGKSTWKKLSRNSLKHNIELMHVLLRYEKNARQRLPSRPLTHNDGLRGYFGDAQYLQTLTFNRIGEAKRLLPVLLSIKKTWLKIFRSERAADFVSNGACYLLDSTALLKWFNQVTHVTKKNSIENCYNLLFDVYNMANDLDLPIKLKSINKVKNYHDHLVKLARQKRKQEDRIAMQAKENEFNPQLAWCKAVWDKAVSSVTAGDVEIEVIADYSRLLRESDDMWHCIADYLKHIASYKRYLVFHLKSAQQESTLGLWFDGSAWVKNQHYGYDNSDVSCNNLLSVVKPILDSLNHFYAMHEYIKHLPEPRAGHRAA